MNREGFRLSRLVFRKPGSRDYSLHMCPYITSYAPLYYIINIGIYYIKESKTALSSVLKLDLSNFNVLELPTTISHEQAGHALKITVINCCERGNRLALIIRERDIKLV